MAKPVEVAEVCFVLAAIVLAVFWILEPLRPLEPWIVIFGLGTVATDLFRRRVSAPPVVEARLPTRRADGRFDSSDMGLQPNIEARIMAAQVDAKVAGFELGLRQLFDPEDPCDKAVFSVESRDNVFIQFAVDPGEQELTGEVVANEFLPSHEQLSVDGLDTLEGLGWNRATADMVNHYKFWAIATEADLRVVALEAVLVLEKVYSVTPHDRLSMDVFE